MRICLAQAKPVTGDIEKNIENHISMIRSALAYDSDAVVFPELSLTGYEPALARELAVSKTDARFDSLQALADAHQLMIAAGVPTFAGDKPHISMIVFQPRAEPIVYSKRFLHEDEFPHFAAGPATIGTIGDRPKIAPAICYEISVPSHSENAARNGAQIYLASVAKTARNIEAALRNLGDIARKYEMRALMVNSVGKSDGQECVGRSSIWNERGELIGQLEAETEGLLIFDTDRNMILARLAF